MDRAIAFNYYTLIEEGKLIAPEYWVRYIMISNEITGKSVKVKKCIRRLKQAHANLSDYYKAQ